MELEKSDIPCDLNVFQQRDVSGTRAQTKEIYEVHLKFQRHTNKIKLVCVIMSTICELTVHSLVDTN